MRYAFALARGVLVDDVGFCKPLKAGAGLSLSYLNMKLMAEA